MIHKDTILRISSHHIYRGSPVTAHFSISSQIKGKNIRILSETNLYIYTGAVALDKASFSSVAIEAWLKLIRLKCGVLRAFNWLNQHHKPSINDICYEKITRCCLNRILFLHQYFHISHPYSHACSSDETPDRCNINTSQLYHWVLNAEYDSLLGWI